MIHGRHNVHARPILVALLMIVACAGAVEAAEPVTASSEAAASGHGAGLHPTRQQLIGMWRLSSIELSGVDGRMVDPFYQADSTGLIAYDASGRMSVQIAASHRVSRELPATRTRAATGREAAAKAAAFDSYYAYFGTWSYDAATSLMTHHVESSLLPAEIGVDFTQEVTLDGDRMIFTNRAANHGQPTTRTKVWQRVGSGD